MAINPIRECVPSALEALLGPSRAALVHSLDRPSTVGQLAARLGFAPSGITHHVRFLEPAGLVVRERRGRSVLVRRTARGSSLVALYRAR